MGNIVLYFCNKSLFRVSFFNVLFSWADRLGRRPEFPKVRPRYGNGVKVWHVKQRKVALLNS